MSQRVEGIDVARGVASLIMIQGHAYHGWVAPAHHDAAYAFTRVLGTLPLPAFLVLAGAAVVLRLEAAARRGEEPRAVRGALVKRGLTLLLIGYATNAAYALIDGAAGLHTWLRADVLHVIGLSLAIGAWVGIPARAPVDPTRFARRASLLGVALTLACPWLAPLGALAPAPLAPLVAPFVDAPPFTAMPVVPLFAWLGFGALAASWLAKHRGDDAISRRAGSSLAALACLAIAGLVLAAAAAWSTGALVAALGGPLSRAHVAVIPNVLDLVGRGLFVLSVGAALSLALPDRARAAFVTLGRGSLVAYVVHIPFCYGKLAGPLLGASDMLQATLALPFLVALSWLAVYARDALRGFARSRRAREAE